MQLVGRCEGCTRLSEFGCQKPAEIRLQGKVGAAWSAEILVAKGGNQSR